MKIFKLKYSQKLPISLNEAWDFLSSPNNLELITPKSMDFNITDWDKKKAYPGQIISYKVSVIRGVRLNWVTEITQVKENHFFIDEQRFGPYKMWHHEHFFEKIDESSCWLGDKVSYKLPFGILGSIAQFLFVKKQLKEIFEFRSKQILNIFK